MSRHPHPQLNKMSLDDKLDFIIKFITHHHGHCPSGETPETTCPAISVLETAAGALAAAGNVINNNPTITITTGDDSNTNENENNNTAGDDDSPGNSGNAPGQEEEEVE